jgi:choline dehydrogenase-like flavoprotein
MDVLQRALPILGLIRDEELRKNIAEHLEYYAANPSEWGTELSRLMNNFLFAVPTSWHWERMIENPTGQCRYRVNGKEITNAQHVQTILEILKEHQMDPNWFAYNGYRARHWDEVRWHDFKIFCILLDRGYEYIQLLG